MFNYRATVALIGLIASKRQHVAKLEAAKLVYIMDKRHLEHYGRSITGDSYVAMKKGPAPSTTLYLINADEENDPRRFNSLARAMDEIAVDAHEVVAYRDAYLNIERTGDMATISAKKDPDMDELSESDVRIAESVLAEFGSSNVSDLLDYVHGLPEYVRNFDAKKGCTPIPVEDIIAAGTKRAQALFALSN